MQTGMHIDTFRRITAQVQQQLGRTEIREAGRLKTGCRPRSFITCTQKRQARGLSKGALGRRHRLQALLVLFEEPLEEAASCTDTMCAPGLSEWAAGTSLEGEKEKLCRREEEVRHEEEEARQYEAEKYNQHQALVRVGRHGNGR